MDRFREFALSVLEKRAAFGALLEKTSQFTGLRGWLYLDGSFDELKSRGKSYHQAFAIERLMQDAGVIDWVNNNPPPDFQLPADSDMRHQIGVMWKHRFEQPEWADWLNRLMTETGVDEEFMAMMSGDADINDYYAKKYGGIRIWGQGDTLLIQSPVWTQKHLDVLWKFILSNIEAEGWEKYELEGDNEVARGKIWDLPERIDKLFQKAPWWRVAGVRVEHNRLIAEDENWSQAKLNIIWKFAIENMGEIKSFSVLGPGGRIRRGDIWELPKKVEELFD